jgi:nitronate monooxygenase
MHMPFATEAMRRLNLTCPIIQGPFGGGLSTPQLAAAVANLGGLGSYGAYHLAPDQITSIVGELKRLTTRTFAVNLWISDHDPGGRELSREAFDRAYSLFEPYFRELGVDKPAPPARYGQRYEEQIEALLEARPPVFSFVFGVPSQSVLAECKRRDIVSIGAATSIAEARLLEQAGVDLIIATGCEAGGHRPSFNARAEDSLVGSMALIPLVADRVSVPVIAAGGIVDGRGIRAALALGAQAAQLGTAFLACEESGASAAHREALFSDRSQDTTLTRAFTGRLARSISNRWSREMSSRSEEQVPFPIQSWFLSQLRPAAIAAGRTDLVSLWSGQAAPNLRHRSVPLLMSELLRDLSATAAH